MSENHAQRPGPATVGNGSILPELQMPLAHKETPKEHVTPTGFFTGFNIKYPEYELITPQTLQEYTIRSMSVAEEEILKGSLITTKSIPSHINNVIWECLVKKPSHIKSKEDFLRTTTIRDRDALIYALYHITYKDVHNYNIACSSCEAKFPITLELSSIFSMKAYDGDPLEILNKRVKVELQHVVGGIAILKQPTLADEEEILQDMLFQSEKNHEIATEMSMIDHFELGSDTRDPVIVQGKQNLFSAYTSLPAGDRKLIDKHYQEEFGKFAVSLNININCQKCGAQNNTRLDLVQQLFRAMYE